MGFLDVFKSKASAAPSLPSGSFTVDRDGVILSSTVSSAVSEENLRQIAAVSLKILAEAREKGLPMSDLTFRFGAMNIRAVDIRMGALIYLNPKQS